MTFEEKDIKNLINSLNDPDWDVRNYIEDILVKIGDQAVEPLIAALGNKDMDIQRESARALGRIGNKKALEPLIARLNDDNVDLRKEVAVAIDKIVDKGRTPK